MSKQNNGGFKDAVCIEVQRIFDSCSDRDCIVDLPVTVRNGTICDGMIVKCKNVTIDSVCTTVHEVPFSKGYFSVDIVYTFDLTFETFIDSCTKSGEVNGTAVWSKKCILFGCEGSTKVFESSADCCSVSEMGQNNISDLPKATVRVVEPICLDARIKCLRSRKGCGCMTSGVAPSSAVYSSENECAVACHDMDSRVPTLVVTLGIFSIVQLSRPVAVVVPALDQCIPHKECSCSGNNESPCEIFERMSFPMEEFFPDCTPESCNPCGCSQSVTCCCDTDTEED